MLFNSGCSPFFISSAISSMLFGKLNYDTQLANSEDRIAFQKQMNLARQKFEDEKFEQELRFKREMLKTGHFFQQIEAKRSFENEKKKLEFNHFESYWPLRIDIHAIWNENIFSKSSPSLTVILSRYNSPKANNDYSNTCDELERYSEKLQNITFKHSAWKFAEQVNVNYNVGGIAQNMNVHYIMQGIPTLIITPQVVGDTLYFDTSIWSFGKGLGSFFNRSMFSMPFAEQEYDQLKDKIRFAQIAIMGVVRDNFMLFEFQKPPVFPKVVEQERLDKYPDVHQFLVTQYGALKEQTTTSTDFKAFCSNRELIDIEQILQTSVNTLNQ
ncbi:MAG: hypothetical protein HXX16_18235 [Bacteroidales bacterium]|nr:hypothetical protein [Bacteroidales bacterium]